MQTAINTTGSTRSATISVNNASTTLTQADSSCTYSLNAPNFNVSPAGGVVQLSITTGPGCPWTVSNPAPAVLTIGGSGSGNRQWNRGSLRHCARAFSSSRLYTVIVTGASFTITQAATVAVTSVTSSTANGTYGTGSSISIQVAFSAAVTVTGTPQLALNSGGMARYSSGSGTPTLTFIYLVGASDISAHLDYAATGSTVRRDDPRCESDQRQSHAAAARNSRIAGC